MQARAVLNLVTVRADWGITLACVPRCSVTPQCAGAPSRRVYLKSADEAEQTALQEEGGLVQPLGVSDVPPRRSSAQDGGDNSSLNVDVLVHPAGFRLLVGPRFCEAVA